MKSVATGRSPMTPDDTAGYRDFIEGMPIALVVVQLTDEDDPRSLELRALNPAARHILDVPADMGATRLVDVIELPDSWIHRLAAVARTSEPFEYPFLEIPGSDSVFAVRAVPLPNRSIGISLEDVTRRARLSRSFRHQAMHDSLTGLPNRANLHARLVDALERRDPDGFVALLVIDLDEFKEINDALGHEYGDRVLTMFARHMDSNLRGCDTIARLGGDEFAVLLTSNGDVDGARRVADRLLALCDRPLQVGDFRLRIDASVGIAVAPDHGIDADSLLRRADGAMYRSKAEGGGGGVVVYTPTQDLASTRRLEILGELRDAVQSDGFGVLYQPRIDLRSCRLLGVEALVRWNHPRHGPLSPKEFIALAEMSGTIHRLTRRVSERASAEFGGLIGAHGLTMSINLSTRNFYDGALAQWVGELIERHDLARGSLCFEINEAQLMDDPRQARDVLEGLRTLGVRFSVDDFGTGSSSISHLRELPIDEVKIDPRFVAELCRDDSIVRSVIDLGHNLGLHVVAEGVEDVATLDRLRKLGCDSAQGRHLGVPMSAGQLAGYVAPRLSTQAGQTSSSA